MKRKVEVDKARPVQNSSQPMKRKLSRDKTRCVVTFWLPKKAAPDAGIVAVAGSFNDWSLDRHPMKRLKDGDFSLDLELEAGKEYEFRFVIDGVHWENAWNADKYMWSAHGNCENSMIVT
jgi:1,4-alpha-glucan branching enzyme